MTASSLDGVAIESRGIKMVFWALDNRRMKLTYREIAVLTEARDRMNQMPGDTTAAIAIVDKMIDDRRRDPLR